MNNGASDAPVLIDSWQGHQRWGEPKLDANHPAVTPQRVQFASLRDAVMTKEWGHPKGNHLALLIHAFYPEQMEQMLQPLASHQMSHGHRIDLYVSTPGEKFDLVCHILKQQQWPTVKIFGVVNCGRDVTPFLLHLLPSAQYNGHKFFVKVHTKASPHLEKQSRQAWSQHLTKSLLTPNAIELIQQHLHADPLLGIVAPSGCLMSISLTLHKNYEHLMNMLRQSSMQGDWALQQYFIAGSMFAGRLKALELEKQSMIDTLWSEQEEGKTDGTISHALERWLSLMAIQHGWKIAELPGQTNENLPGFGYQRIK